MKVMENCCRTSRIWLDYAQVTEKKCNLVTGAIELLNNEIRPKSGLGVGVKSFGDNMSQIEEAKFPQFLVLTLEKFLDELDQFNLIQTAARVASAIDTLKAEIAVNFPDDDIGSQGSELVRASERD